MKKLITLVMVTYLAYAPTMLIKLAKVTIRMGPAKLAMGVKGFMLLEFRGIILELMAIALTKLATKLKGV